MTQSVPSVSVTYARNGRSTRANEFGMRPMQERAYAKQGKSMNWYLNCESKKR